MGGISSGVIHIPQEKEDLDFFACHVQIDRTWTLKAVRVMGGGGAVIPLGDLLRVDKGTVDRSIYHKNLMPVVYVTAMWRECREPGICHPRLDQDLTA